MTKRDAAAYPRIWPVCLRIGEETARFTGLLDTGNCLYDGYADWPVCVMDRSGIEQFFPSLAYKIEGYLSGKDAYLNYGFHYIPYRSLGCPKGILLVFTAEFLVVQEKRNERKTLHPRIAVCDSDLLFGRTYQIILHPDVLQRGRSEHGRLCSRQRAGEGLLSGFYKNSHRKNR